MNEHLFFYNKRKKGMDYQWKEADNRKRKEGMEKERRGMSYLS